MFMMCGCIINKNIYVIRRIWWRVVCVVWGPTYENNGSDIRIENAIFCFVNILRKEELFSDLDKEDSAEISVRTRNLWFM
jgi:hypothetical protein